MHKYSEIHNLVLLNILPLTLSTFTQFLDNCTKCHQTFVNVWSLFQTNTFRTSLRSTLWTSKVHQVLEADLIIKTKKEESRKVYITLMNNDKCKTCTKRQQTTLKKKAKERVESLNGHTKTDTRTASQELATSSSSHLFLLSIIYQLEYKAGEIAHAQNQGASSKSNSYHAENCMWPAAVEIHICLSNMPMCCTSYPKEKGINIVSNNGDRLL